MTFYLAFLLLAVLGSGAYFIYETLAREDDLKLHFLLLSAILVVTSSLGAAYKAANFFLTRRRRLSLESRLARAQSGLKDMRYAAASSSHPLLAKVIEQQEAEGSDLLEWVGKNPAFARDAKWIEHSQKFLLSCSRLRRRVRSARFAFKFGLPLTRENAANFAVVNISARIERLSDLVAPGIHALDASKERENSHV